ncbi:putative BOI-related E3 ubiquitin-protein ligase 1 [Cocos nucifera]|uniref:Putative BOI-related E3 ubiquitin-protein ligase 1 n=1 Tax=Cocos nucifera TaxID=13894 RepID=A0A8K0I2A3_COCNU|nr:putative BOI-related E3 ubiquitin-protein ligase 1 [Cocos nucifera]
MRGTATTATDERQMECRNSSAQDAKSAHFDQYWAPPSACWSCREAPASVVVLSYCHLCLCPDCDSTIVDGGGIQSYPIYQCTTTESLHIIFS